MFYACMHTVFVNWNLQLPPEKTFVILMQILLFCNVFCLVPNICYRPNIRQHFLPEYLFSAETRKSVFGRSLLLASSSWTRFLFGSCLVLSFCPFCSPWLRWRRISLLVRVLWVCRLRRTSRRRRAIFWRWWLPLSLSR
jgi:hypothetical protein